MPHYTRTHKSAARLQMHTPSGSSQRAYVVRATDGFLYTLYPDRDIHWPENRVPASTKIFHHLGSMGIQAWLLTIALFAPLSPVHFARWCSIPAMDTLPAQLQPSPLPLHFPANLQPGQPPPPYRRALAFVRWTEFEGIDGPPARPTPRNTHRRKKGWTTRQSNRTEIGFYTGQLSFVVLRQIQHCAGVTKLWTKEKNQELMYSYIVRKKEKSMLVFACNAWEWTECL